MTDKRTALLIINLGTPKSTDPDDVGRYLKEFLTDKHVIDIPYLLRQILVRALIVPKRKYSAAENYKKVWMPEGSPLLVYTERLVEKLSHALCDSTYVTYAMRYAGPSIFEKLLELKEQNFERIIAFPVYPHDTKSSVLTVVEQIDLASDKLGLADILTTIKPFYEEDFYINSYAHYVQQTMDESGANFVLFSYHGIPQHHLPKACEPCKNPCNSLVPISDCYRAQCFRTSDLIAQKLGLDRDSYMTAFQSRLGKRPWIKPYSDEVIHELSQRGVRNMAVATPSFISDCLETLEEVAMELKEDFEELGPDHKLTAVPCANDDDYFVGQVSGHLTQVMANL